MVQPTQRHVPVPGAPRLHEAQRPKVTLTSPQVVVEATDDEGRRLRFDFDTYQALRVRSIDVYQPRGDIWQPFCVAEVQHSPWIAELRDALAKVDHDADFLDGSHHWMLHCGDDVVEVVAWEMSWTAV